MHDPQSVAHEIYLGRKEKKNGHYRSPLITIWHCDPEKDGSDDSCGWFIRLRHVDPVLVEKVRREFKFAFEQFHWFNSQGDPKFSTMGIALDMYNTAAWQVFIHLNNGKPDRKRHNKFMRNYLFDILHFSENPTDSIHSSINRTFPYEKAENNDLRIEDFVSIILPDIMRKIRPWYKHPRWHIHHWKIQVPMLQAFWRYYFQRCSVCRKRGFHGQSAYTDWYGTKIWCQSCNDKQQNPSPMPNTKNE